MDVTLIDEWTESIYKQHHEAMLDFEHVSSQTSGDSDVEKLVHQAKVTAARALLRRLEGLCYIADVVKGLRDEVGPGEIYINLPNIIEKRFKW